MHLFSNKKKNDRFGRRKLCHRNVRMFRDLNYQLFIKRHLNPFSKFGFKTRYEGDQYFVCKTTYLHEI